ncbi:pyrophosphatase [Thalassospira xiamenensis]|uniref:nucleoside triphosphate pyrophosphohydrolase family protein n=1 Tax=Thalassospira xiamenensis TaxID=220697 RepID=UPI000DED719F|nr:nucleoside triphosphate pyrophosphohydrolase family protein [Thalassospira xiamenensis]RCK33940.1 pyrophosphatase [Thalassospira xiamenensis]
MATSSLGLNEYQTLASRSDRTRDKGNGFDLPVLGLVGEVGSLLSEVKKRQRDTAAIIGYEQTVLEELGDTLWYLAIIAEHAEIKLASLASDDLDTVLTFFDLQPQHLLPLNTPSAQFEKTLLRLAAATGELAAAADDSQGDKLALQTRLNGVLKLLVQAANEAEVFLEDAARANLRKTEDRWPQERIYPELFDGHFHADEQLPRTLEIDIYERTASNGKRYVLQSCHGLFIGDRLTDNIMEPDDYRFHDVFHYAYAAVLGWSPVTRALLKRKRKSKVHVDEGEDGARAVLIEEGVATYVFGIAKDFNFFANQQLGDLSLSLLKNVRQFVRGYEAQTLPLWLWEDAILQGNSAFRYLREKRRGRIKVDVDKRLLSIEELPS